MNLITILTAMSMILFISCATTQSVEDIKSAEAHNKLGALYLNNNKLNQAFLEFQKSVSLNPKNKEALNYLGYISARFNKLDEAIMYYERAIEVEPQYADAMNNLGTVYLDMKKWDEAIKYFKMALTVPLYATPEKSYSSMGYAYYMKGEYENAENVLKESLLRNPVFPLSMYTLGLVYTKVGKYDLAVKEFKKAIGIVPNYVDAHWELARTYLLMNEKGKAIKHFEVVAEEDENMGRRNEAADYIRRLRY